MVHYQPSAQVPARRGGRTAGPTPAAGAAASAGRARARGRRAAFVGPRPAVPRSPRERLQGERAFARLIYGPHMVEGEGVGSPLPALLPPYPPGQSLLRESCPGPGHLPSGMLGLQSPGVPWAGEVLLANELPQTYLQSVFWSPVPGGSALPGAWRAGLLTAFSDQESCVKVYYHEKNSAPRLH